ncbi:MAG: S-ribosylhomocysteine lyase [Clostridiales bacterium]|nr:S-ribosylhomocysteine lyase [Clostridiales bacterium]
MDKIESFKINHNTLKEGIYISRVDGDVITYDLRTRKPNQGDFMDNVTMHSVEHMFATYIRNSKISDSVLYFGPMGCQTGVYLLGKGVEKEVVLEEVIKTLKKIIEHDGEVFGNTQLECGNYKTLDLQKAKIECERYLNVLSNKVNDFKYEE